MSYATVAEAELDNKLNEVDPNVDPDAPAVIEGRRFLVQALVQTSNRIDEYCKQQFAPRYELRRIDANRQNIDAYLNTVFLPQPLLEVESVKVLDTELTSWDGVTYSDQADKNYYVYPLDSTPYYMLQGINGGVWSPATYNSVIPRGGAQAISVLGWWGFRTHYSTEGWRNTGDTVQANPLSATAVTITVTDVDGTTWDGSTPRFSAGQLLRIESEYVEVVATDADTNVLTVVRGVRGTTAAIHVQNTPIYTFVVEPDINRACLRWVNYLYERRAVYQTTRIDIPGSGMITDYPKDIPEEVRGILDMYVYHTIRAV